MPSPRVIRMSRWIAALIAVAAMVCAAFLMYQSLFNLERFFLPAILLAITLWLAATVLWWFVAEAEVQITRTRIRHILVGGMALGFITLLVFVIRFRSIVDGVVTGLVLWAPLAFIFGGTLGALYSLLRLRGTRAI